MNDQSSIISLRRKLEKEAWEIKSLGEIATEIISGNEVTKEQLGTGDYPSVKCGDINSKFRESFSTCIGFINKDLLKNPKFCEYGDILISYISNKVSTVGKASAYLGNERPTVGQNLYIIKHNENPKFLSYMLNSDYVRQQITSVARDTIIFLISKTSLQKIKIPFPPKHIQDQIVEYLDKWTFLESQLEQELEQELEQRKKQYEYYKESLLNSGIDKWEIYSLNKVITEIISGNEITKDQLGTGNYPAIKCGDVNSKFGSSFLNCVGFVNPDLVKSKVFCEYGDVLIGALSHNIERIGKVTTYLGSEKPIVGSDIFLIKHQQNSRFLSYILGSEFVRSQMKKISTKGAVVHMYKSKLHLLQIPLPSLEEQSQIVELLYKFHTITESFKDGLPSLIEKHRKQYTYYKEQILNPEISL